MKTTSYRLAEYRIIESGTGALWWEGHAGIGAVVGGKCYIRGKILFIGPRESEEPGFLAKEFLNQLDRFPKWEKTRFYCLSYEICDCKSGRKLTEEEIAAGSRNQTQWTEETGLSGTLFGKGNRRQGSGATEDVSYRLGRYEIIQKRSGQVWWKTPSGRTGLRVGKSIIAGDILFIGTVETEEPGNLRRQFIDRLDQLPEWRTTQYYSLSYALHDCGTGKSLSKGAGGRWPSADSLPKGEGLSRKNAKLSETFNLSFSKLRKLLRAIHPHAKTRAALPKDSVAAEEETREKGVKTGSSRRTNAGKLNLSSWDTAIQWLGRKKWIGYIAAFLLITGFLLMAVLVGHWEKEEGHHKRDDHHSSHRSDH
jgi:hypothetical protein